MVSDEYVEAVVWLRSAEDRPRVEELLTARGLRALPIRAGLLAQARPPAFEAAFGVDLAAVPPPVTLPVPAELRDGEEETTVPAPRRYPGASVAAGGAEP